MASTGLPGMRRGSRKFSIRATTRTTRVQASFRPMYFASTMMCAFAPRDRWTVPGLRPQLLDLEQPLNAGALPHRRSVRVFGGGEVRPVVGVELVELQRAVHQRHHGNVLAVDRIELGVSRLRVGGVLGSRSGIQQSRDLGVAEPVVVPEGRLAGGGHATVVHGVPEPN